MQQIGFVVFPEFQVMGFAAITAFEIANLMAGEPFYEVTLLSEHGGPVRSSAGFNVETEPFGDRNFDTAHAGCAGHALDREVLSGCCCSYFGHGVHRSDPVFQFDDRRLRLPVTGRSTGLEKIFQPLPRCCF